MKVLLVHNHYGSQSPSGENRVFELERDMLIRNGHEIETVERFSDVLRARRVIGAVRGALMTPWNPLAAHAIEEVMRRFQPDIVHAHNTFPMLSPSIFPAARGAGRVLSLHNYRLVCPAAIPMRSGQVCTKCMDGRTVWPAIRHACYRNSRAATLPLAMNVAFNRWRGTWDRDVERFIVFTKFQRDMMIHAGLPSERIAIKPNFYPGTPRVIPFRERPSKVVFVGRLSEEKGVGDLIDAWLEWGGGAPDLRIIGDGPLRRDLEDRASGTPCISFLGQVDHAVAEQEIASARILILPSRCFEGFPMVVREAFALATPVAVSDVGPLPDLVASANGAVFRAGNPKNLLENLSALWKQTTRLQKMSEASLQLFKKKYSERENYRLLMEIYDSAIEARKS
jgi:glycosyltransferase involved in cell wall biosynthesis